MPLQILENLTTFLDKSPKIWAQINIYLILLVQKQS